MPRLILLALSLLLCASAAWSQTATDTGSSVIRGRVIATATGRGIRGATVSVTAPELRQARTATTDADGRYELKDLPSGRYTMSAGKPTFITLQRGQTRPFEAAKPLVLGDKETIGNVDFSLPRGGVITGRVVDELGDPVVNVTVRAMRMRYVPGGRDDLRSVGIAVPTNDLGVFRIFGLSPGEYYVFASLRYALASDPAGSAFASSYFPGVTTLVRAERVTVALGQTAAIADLTLTPVKTSTVTGRVVDADGRPVSAGGLNLGQRPPAPPEGIGFTQVRPDGTFRVSNVPAGDYDLDFSVSEVNFETARPGQAPRAIVHLALDGSDVSDVVMTLTRMSGGIGRVILPSGAPPLNPSAVRLSPFPTDPYEDRWYGGEATVKDDLSFDFTSPPGQMTLRVVTPRGWALKEVRHGGKVVTDTGLTLAPGEKAKDIQVELTNQPPIISGTVRGAKGEPAEDYAVVLFAQDLELRRNSSRYFAVVRPDQSGQFRLDTLPPGEYLAVALDYVDPNEAGNPDLLRRLEPGATRFGVREGQTQSLALRITVP